MEPLTGNEDMEYQNNEKPLPFPTEVAALIMASALLEYALLMF